MDEYKDIYPKDIDEFNKIMEKKEDEYCRKIGRNLRDNLQKLNKSSDYGKLKIFSEDLIYLNYKYQKRIQQLKKKIIEDKISIIKKLPDFELHSQNSYIDELLNWVEQKMEII